MDTKAKTWAERELQAFFERLERRPDWRCVPKGVTVLRRKARRGELYDRAEFIIASKGRTGASVRAALQKHLRNGFAGPRLHKSWPA